MNDGDIMLNEERMGDLLEEVTFEPKSEYYRVL